MTQISRPWQGRTSQGALGDAGPYTAAQWAETWRTMIGTGANYANRGVIRGVDNELLVSANSPAAQNVLVGSGAALVGGRWHYNNAPETVSIAANASGSTRNDIIILEADYTLQTVRIDVIQGTPAAGLPSLIQNLTGIYQIPLAYLTLASGFATITASMVTDYREYANIPDAVGYLATNASGGVLENGALVVPTGTQSFTTTTSLSDIPAGILERRTANGALGRIITHGIFSVICEASVNVGDYLGSSNTAGQAEIAGAFAFARVLVANTGAGTRALCFISVQGYRKPPACLVYNNANQVFGGSSVVSFNSELYDNNSMHNNAVDNSRITFNVSGIYTYTFNAFVTAAISVTIRLNGGTILMLGATTTASANFWISITGQRSFSAGDYIEVIVNAAVTVTAANDLPNFSATWLSGA